MWVTKHSLYEVAGIVLAEGLMASNVRGRRIRCKECESPLSYRFTGRALRGSEDVRLVGEVYCQYCMGEPSGPSYGTPIDPADIVKIAL